MDQQERRAQLLDQLAQTRAELGALVREQGAWLNLDFTMGQLRTMVLLNRKEPTFVSDVSTLLGISRPAASTLVDRLVQLKMIDRTEDRTDRRRTLVALTLSGRQLVDQLLNGPSSIRESISHLPLGDLAALAQGSAALVRQLKKDALMSHLANMAEPSSREPVVRDRV